MYLCVCAMCMSFCVGPHKCWFNLSFSQATGTLKSKQSTTHKCAIIIRPFKRVPGFLLPTFAFAFPVAPPLHQKTQIRCACENRLGRRFFIIANTAVVAFFVLELAVNFTAEGCRDFFRGNERSWNIFDFIIIAPRTIWL